MKIPNSENSHRLIERDSNKKTYENKFIRFKYAVARQRKNTDRKRVKQKPTREKEWKELNTNQTTYMEANKSK